jgi:hypothetical protein
MCIRLYEITDQFKALDSFIPEVESVEDSSAWSELWEGLQVELADKVHGLCCVIRNTEGEAMAIDAEIKRLTAKKKALENKVENLTSYLEYNLKSSDSREVKTSIFTVKFAKTPEAVKILDESALPANMMRVKTEPDKTAIKAAIKGGREVPGARLEVGERLVIK